MTRFSAWLWLIVLFGLLTSCTQTDTTSIEKTPSDSVALQLSWLHTISFVGPYMAQEKGYYAAQNLQVDLREGGLDDAGNFINPITEVTSGRADFGIVDSTILLKARAEGEPIVAIASMYQRHPMALISLADKNINRLQDLVGQRVQISFNANVIYQAMLATQNIDPTTIDQRERTDFSMNPILNDEVDVTEGWITNEAVQYDLAGHAINMIMPSDYGIEVYPNVIFTTEAMIDKNPELVARFVRATVQGLQASVDQPTEAAQTVFDHYNQEGGLPRQDASMSRALPLLNLVDSPPGMMNDKVWADTHQILLDQHILTEPIDVTMAYRLEFLRNIYTD